MSHEFELHQEIDIPASPAQVWEAIATGPGVDSWFMGRTQIEPGPDGAVSFTMLGQTVESAITAWEPDAQFGYHTPPGPDGSFMAFDYLIETRGGGGTTLRLVQYGVLGGDGWEAEYEAMEAGWPMYLATLVAYLTHFPQRTATPVTAVHPGAGDPDTVFDRLRGELGLPRAADVGAPATLAVAATPHQDGVVDCVSRPHYLGIRTADGLYRFLHTGVERGNALVIGHHLFGVTDPENTAAAWRAWLTDVFASE